MLSLLGLAGRNRARKFARGGSGLPETLTPGVNPNVQELIAADVMELTNPNELYIGEGEFEAGLEGLGDMGAAARKCPKGYKYFKPLTGCVPKSWKPPKKGKAGKPTAPIVDPTGYYPPGTVVDPTTGAPLPPGYPTYPTTPTVQQPGASCQIYDPLTGVPVTGYTDAYGRCVSATTPTQQPPSSLYPYPQQPYNPYNPYNPYPQQPAFNDPYAAAPNPLYPSGGFQQPTSMFPTSPFGGSPGYPTYQQPSSFPSFPSYGGGGGGAQFDNVPGADFDTGGGDDFMPADVQQNLSPIGVPQQNVFNPMFPAIQESAGQEAVFESGGSEESYGGWWGMEGLGAGLGDAVDIFKRVTDIALDTTERATNILKGKGAAPSPTQSVSAPAPVSQVPWGTIAVAGLAVVGGLYAYKNRRKLFR